MPCHPIFRRRNRTSVAPFVPASCPLPGGHTDDETTALQLHRGETRPAFQPSYLRHSPSPRRLKHEPDQRLASGTNPIAVDLPRLAKLVARSLASVGHASVPAGSRMSGTPVPSSFTPVSSQLRDGTSDFWRQNAEAPPYPSAPTYPIRLRLRSHSPARAFAPFIVELFAVRFSFTDRRGDHPGGVRRRTPAPDAGCVVRTRWLHEAAIRVRTPQEGLGFTASLSSSIAAHGSGHCHSQGFVPVALILVQWSRVADGIEAGDYSRLHEDYFQQLHLEPDEHLSMHPALRIVSMTGG